MPILELLFSFCTLILLITFIISVYYFFTARDILNGKIREFRSLSKEMFKEENTKARKVKKTQKKSSNIKQKVEVEDAEFREVN